MLWVLLAMLVVHQFRRLSTLPRRMASYPSRQSHWKAQAPQSLPGPTFAGQPKLPNLPVPELENTLEKLKQSLKPIAWSTAEYNAALAKIDRFARIGPKFQHRLLQRHATTDHWLEEWWDRDAYLAYRDSVVINVSYYCALAAFARVNKLLILAQMDSKTTPHIYLRVLYLAPHLLFELLSYSVKNLNSVRCYQRPPKRAHCVWTLGGNSSSFPCPCLSDQC